MTHPHGSRAGLRSVAALWIAGPLWYVAAEAITASAFPNYSYAHNYISDLGVPEKGVIEGRILDSPLHTVMNAGFIGEGLLFFLGLVLLLPHLKRAVSTKALVAFAVMHSVGIALVGLVPGSEANVNNGLISWHVLGAVAAIAGGNLVAIVAGTAIDLPLALRRTGQILGVVGFLCAFLLNTHVLLPDGVWERGAVYTFMAWQFIAGLALLQIARAAREGDHAASAGR